MSVNSKIQMHNIDCLNYFYICTFFRENIFLGIHQDKHNTWKYKKTRQNMLKTHIQKHLNFVKHFKILCIYGQNSVFIVWGSLPGQCQLNCPPSPLSSMLEEDLRRGVGFNTKTFFAYCRTKMYTERNIYMTVRDC